MKRNYFELNPLVVLGKKKKKNTTWADMSIWIANIQISAQLTNKLA